MMTHLTSPRLVVGLLSVTAFSLALVIGAELGWGSRLHLPLPQVGLSKGVAAVAQLQPEFVLPPLDEAYTEILERPLFIGTRRPPPPAPVAEDLPRSNMRKGQFVLVGVILTPGKNIALLREAAGNKVLRVKQGDEINGMQLEKMESERVFLRQGGEREELVLRIQAMPKAPQVPQAPQAAQPQPPPAQAGQVDAPQAGAPAAAAASSDQAAQPNAAAAGSPEMQDFIARRRALRGSRGESQNVRNRNQRNLPK